MVAEALHVQQTFFYAQPNDAGDIEHVGNRRMCFLYAFRKF